MPPRLADGEPCGEDDAKIGGWRARRGGMTPRLADGEPGGEIEKMANKKLRM